MKYSVKDLMRELFQIDIEPGQSFHCPFPAHGGEDTRPSAVYFEAANDIHCFKEGRSYDVADIMMAAGIPSQKIVGLAMADLPERRSEGKGSKSIEECRRLFQEKAESAVALFRAGRLPWEECWKDLDAYFESVAGEKV